MGGPLQVRGRCGGLGRIRTGDHGLTRDLLYPLSYEPVVVPGFVPVLASAPLPCRSGVLLLITSDVAGPRGDAPYYVAAYTFPATRPGLRPRSDFSLKSSVLTPHPAALGGLGFCCSTSTARSFRRQHKASLRRRWANGAGTQTPFRRAPGGTSNHSRRTLSSYDGPFRSSRLSIADVKKLLNVVGSCEIRGRLRCNAGSLGYRDRIRKALVHGWVTLVSRNWCQGINLRLHPSRKSCPSRSGLVARPRTSPLRVSSVRSLSSPAMSAPLQVRAYRRGSPGFISDPRPRR